VTGTPPRPDAIALYQAALGGLSSNQVPEAYKPRLRAILDDHPHNQQADVLNQILDGLMILGLTF
jgi:hypothetical protein